MIAKNKYAKRSKISEAKFRKLIQYFASDLDAKTIAAVTNLNRNTVNRYLNLIRKRIAEFCEQRSLIERKIEDCRCYFGIRCSKIKESQGTHSDAPIFRIFRQGSKVYTECISSIAESMIKVTKYKNPETVTDIIFDDDMKIGGNGIEMLDFGEHTTPDQLTKGKDRSKSIELFWFFAKDRLKKFNGIPKSTFYLHLKECEFRFNYRNENIYPILLKMIRENPLCQ